MSRISNPTPAKLATPIRRLRLLVAYDGAPFHGWQRQNEQETVQGAIEAAATTFCGGIPILVRGASRTDAGVHAEGQVAVIDDPLGRNDLRAWLRGLNALTPRAITIREVVEVDPAFTPRFDSKGKRYRYRFWSTFQPPPLLRPQVWLTRGALDVEAMNLAAKRLLGEHDFTSFRASDCKAKTAVRTLTKVEIVSAGDGYFSPLDQELQGLTELVLEGNAFLKNMVRIIAGTLVEVGLGRRDPQWVTEVLELRDRTLAGRTAPAQGLSLLKVYF